MHRDASDSLYYIGGGKGLSEFEMATLHNREVQCTLMDPNQTEEWY